MEGGGGGQQVQRPGGETELTLSILQHQGSHCSQKALSKELSEEQRGRQGETLLVDPKFSS